MRLNACLPRGNHAKPRKQPTDPTFTGVPNTDKNLGMASVDLTADVPFSRQKAWKHVSDLCKLGDWLVVHEAWRGDVPDELTVGTTVEGLRASSGER